MTFKEKCVVDILLLITRWVAPEPWAQDIKRIATHISVHGKEIKVIE